MLDPYVFLAPILLLPVIALLRFIGCYSPPSVVENPHPIVLVNCGGMEINDSTGVWQDDSVPAGSVGVRFTSTGGDVFTKLDPDPVLDGTHASSDIYTTCRFGPSFSYVFTVPTQGQYGVKLKFAELSPEVGPRVFNFTISGGPNATLVKQDFDITAEAGGAFKVKDVLFLLTVNAAQTITIQFMQGQANFPLVNAIEIAN